MIRRLGALSLILAVTIAAERTRAASDIARTIALPLGFSLIVASLVAEAGEWLRLPRLSGYLLFGLVAGPFVLNLITSTMARDLRVVNGLALALIALIAGLELNVARLRPHLRSVATLGGVLIAGTLVALWAVLWVAWPWLPFGAHQGGAASRLAPALVTATLVASFSPTVTIAVIAESRARGPVTDLVMAIVIMADVALILVFALAMQAARWTVSGGGHDVGLAVHLAWEVVGSLAFGGVVGSLLAFYLRLVGRELTLVLLGACAVLAIASPALHFEPILAALGAGLVVENLAPPEGDALRVAIERAALPVLILFFAAAGASLQLDALAAIGGTAVLLAALRFGVIRGIAEVAVRAAGTADTTARHAWTGLISQAGVTLGLATIVAKEFPGWGNQVATLVVGLTGLHLLVGPIVFKAGLARAGELTKAE